MQRRNFIACSEKLKNSHSCGDRNSEASPSGLALPWFNFSWGCAGGGERWVKAVVTLADVLRRVPLFAAETESVSSAEHARCFEVEGKLLTMLEFFSVKMIPSQRPACQKKKKNLRVRCVPCASVLLQPGEL